MRVSASAAVTLQSDTRRVLIRTEADVWTVTQRNLSLWDILDFFPADAVGPRGPSDEPRPYEVKPITIETDIQYGSWMFRPRSPKQPGMMRWCRERGIEMGDAIVFERTGEQSYRLWLEKAGEQQASGGEKRERAGGAE